MEKAKKDDKYKIGDLDYTNSSSVTDCTGLIPASPITEEEYDSYNDVYSFQPVKLSAEADKLKNPVSKMTDE